MNLRKGAQWALLGFLILVLSLLLMGPPSDPDTNQRPFDSALWKACPYSPSREEPNPRYEVVGDLVNRVGLMGRTPEEVGLLLGRGDSARYGWDLGPGRGFLESGSESLGVDFGPDGRVNRVRWPRHE